MENSRKLQIRSPYYEPHEITREDYILGRGSFGIVYKGKLTDGNGEIALKLLKKLNGDPIREFSEEHQKEIEVLLEAKHKNIVKFLGVVRKPIVYYHNEQPFLCDFLIFEFMANGKASDYVRYMERTQEILFEISYGISCGMAYLHENGIIHRDLAARNILIDAKHQAKISDFGLSRLIDEHHDHYTITETTIRPIRWIARECLEIGGKFNKSSDIWSFGVTLWEIWNRGETPYGDMNKEEVKLAISEGKSPMSFEIPDGIPEGIKILLDYIFVEEELRPPFARIKIILNNIRDGNGNLSSERRECQKNQSQKLKEGQISNWDKNEEFFTAKSTNIPEDGASPPHELNLDEIEIKDRQYKLDEDNAKILSSIKENYSVNHLSCKDISGKKIPEILRKFKAIQYLEFMHCMDESGKCVFRHFNSREYGCEDCIFKMPQNTLENMNVLGILNLEINPGDVNIGHENLPNLKELHIIHCDIRGNLVDTIVTHLLALETIILQENTPPLEKEEVEALLRMKSLKFIHLNGWISEVISGSFAPIGPDGKRFPEIKQNAIIEFKRDSHSQPWKMKMNPKKKNLLDIFSSFFNK